MPEPLPILAPMSEHWRVSNERHVGTLSAVYRAAARSLVMSCWAHGLAVVIVQARRTDAEQYELWRKGRETMGPNASAKKTFGDTVTEAKTAYDTPHGCGMAVDVAFLVDDKTSWSPSLPWAEYGAVVRSLGQAWGGDFAFPDLGHAQHANWRAYRRAA